jgi:outer membrane protein assembly factor BamA
MKKIYLLFTFILLLNIDSQAFNLDNFPTDTTKVKRNSFAGFPIVYSTPETSWAFGAIGLYAFRIKGEADASRPSQVSIAAAYTLNKQVLLFVPFQLFVKDEKYYTYGEVGYYRYNYFYSGIGNDINPADEEVFDVNFPRIKWNALAEVSPNLYAGFRYWYDGYDIVGTKENGLIETNKPIGAEGGNVSGVGPMAVFDNRDNIFTTTNGYFIEAASLFAFEGIGSDYKFSKFSLDVRKFFPIGKQKKSVLGLNLYGEFTGGDIPFFQLSYLGGGKRMRGYLEGRYRDKHHAMMQAEYRFPIFWRFGGVVFASTGGVAPQVGGVFNDLRLAYGGGIRFLLNKEEGANIRIDYGVGAKGNSGFYLTIGEAF